MWYSHVGSSSGRVRHASRGRDPGGLKPSFSIKSGIFDQELRSFNELFDLNVPYFLGCLTVICVLRQFYDGFSTAECFLFFLAVGIRDGHALHAVGPFSFPAIALCSEPPSSSFLLDNPCSNTLEYSYLVPSSAPHDSRYHDPTSANQTEPRQERRQNPKYSTARSFLCFSCLANE